MWAQAIAHYFQERTWSVQPLRIIGIFVLGLVCSSSTYAQSTGNSDRAVLTFLSHRTGYNQLYQSRPDGTDEKPIFGGPITDVPSFDASYKMYLEPHWTRQSPNGKYFASWVFESGKPYSTYQGEIRAKLMVGALDGTWKRVVNPDCHEEFAWSPDSKQLAFSVLSRSNYSGALQNRPDTTEIFVSGIDGSNRSCILEKNGKWVVLDWSPNGERLLIENRIFGRKAADYRSDLFEFRLFDALKARSQSEFDPDWSVNKAHDFLTPIELSVKELQSSCVRYSPTRNELALEVNDSANMYAPNLVADDELGRGRMMRLLGKIYVLDREKSELRKVADYDDGIRGPICWSPDGNDILFSRYLPKSDDREKFAEDKEHGLSIWAVSRDGKNARFVTTGWSPDFPRAAMLDKK